MEDLLENEYQLAKVCDDEVFRRILNLHDLPSTLYPTAQSFVMESAKSDFERVPFNQFDSSACEQTKRRIDCDDARASLVGVQYEVADCKRKLDDFIVSSQKELKELGDSLEEKRVEFCNLDNSLTVEEQCIVTHEGELDQLRLQRYIDDTSAGIVGALDTAREKEYDDSIKDQFLVVFGPNDDINCI
mmetsp:Transcript_26774/g.30082  ORF Transcript_26774/g.30082 Transcript_26774/m.30082 type:complete len:188 (-) Transcript_26774:450-1013(-)